MWVKWDNNSSREQMATDLTSPMARLRESPVATHFRSASHSEADLSVCVIDRLWMENVIQKRNRKKTDGSGLWKLHGPGE